jgi:hypothetical protein
MDELQKLIIQHIRESELKFGDIVPLESGDKWKVSKREADNAKLYEQKLYSISLLAINKLVYGVSYAPLTEKFLKEDIFPILRNMNA